MNNIKKFSILTITSSLLAISSANAQIIEESGIVVGDSSDHNQIVIEGTSPLSLPHNTDGGQPGIRVSGAEGGFAEALLSFKTYQLFAGYDGLIDGYKVSTLSTTDMPANHSSLGNFDFLQVPNQDVYFGEWTAERNFDGMTQTHTVYYGGQNKTTNLPNNGVAQYSVKGISNFDGNRHLSGNLEANFNTNKINGDLNLSNKVLTLKILDNDININDASFSGDAKYTRGYKESEFLNGSSKGHFFGSQASAIAGIATFDGYRQFDAAFGGFRTDITEPHDGIVTMSE